MTDWIMNNLWASGGVVIALLFVLHRILSTERLKQWGYNVGYGISSFGRSKLGDANWERLENAIESWGTAFIGAIWDGLNADDSENKKEK